MQYDTDLIKKILLHIEAKNDLRPDKISISGYDNKIIAYHCLLLHDGGYIEADFEESSTGAKYPIVTRLTMQGVMFLQSARNETIWEKAQKLLKEKSLSVPLSVLTELLQSLIKEAVGIK